MNTKAILATTLIAGLLAASSASAQGRAGDLSIELNNSAAQKVSLQKVSYQSAYSMAGDLSVEVNGNTAKPSSTDYVGVNR